MAPKKVGSLGGVGSVVAERLGLHPQKLREQGSWFTKGIWKDAVGMAGGGGGSGGQAGLRAE